MDVDFLKAIANIENTSEPFCILNIKNSVHVFTNLDKTYSDIEEIPDNVFATGYQNYDSKSGQWCTWINEKVITHTAFQDRARQSDQQKIKSTHHWTTNMNQNEYVDLCEKMIEDMQKGEYFLANLTRKIETNAKVDPIKVAIQSTFDHDCEFRYFFFSPEYSYLSLSPERFISINDGLIMSQPIKGTAAQYGDLFDNDKDREENTMVVDLVRADLSQVCVPNSIEVSDFQKITKHPGLVQMNSTITGRLENDFEIRKTIKQLMPIASVTGTPKPRVTKIINEYENLERGIYCGAIGWIDITNNSCDLSVAIRGIEFVEDKVKIGVGSGITSRSIALKEFEETELKASRLSLLVEKNTCEVIDNIFTSTFVSSNKEIFALDKHIERLNKSCKEFNIDCDLSNIELSIERYLDEKLHHEGKLKILIDTSGQISFEIEKLNKDLKNVGISIDSTTIKSLTYSNIAKSNPRKNYIEAFTQSNKLSKNEIQDCIIVEQGLVKESMRANIFVRFDNIVITPKIQSNILKGVFRQIIAEYLKAENNYVFKESEISVNDLENADEIVLVNAVIGANLIEKIDCILFPKLENYRAKNHELYKLFNELFNNNLA